MTQKQDNLYREMMAAIEGVQQLGLPASVEASFWIAGAYWEKLKEDTDWRELNDKTVAVQFFRHTKPRFTCQVLYYTMLTEVLLFVPEHSDEQQLYWERELKRSTRFCAKNREFVDYYDTGKQHKDELYFVPVRRDSITEPRMRFDEDIRFCSAKDYLVRGILAHRMYHAFVQRRLYLLTAKL